MDIGRYKNVQGEIIFERNNLSSEVVDKRLIFKWTHE